MKKISQKTEYDFYGVGAFASSIQIKLNIINKRPKSYIYSLLSKNSDIALDKYLD